jgi:hypothetical protein
MHNEKPQAFIDIDYRELNERITDYDERGWRFVNICGSTVEGGVELIYSFSDGLPLENLRFTVSNEEIIPSVSDRFPNAFFFENETHDLFGVRFSGISIDFDGEFYTVAVPTPMNPHSADAREAAANNTYGAANYGACPVPESELPLGSEPKPESESEPAAPTDTAAKPSTEKEVR